MRHCPCFAKMAIAQPRGTPRPRAASYLMPPIRSRPTLLLGAVGLSPLRSSCHSIGPAARFVAGFCLHPVVGVLRDRPTPRFRRLEQSSVAPHHSESRCSDAAGTTAVGCNRSGSRRPGSLRVARTGWELAGIGPTSPGPAERLHPGPACVNEGNEQTSWTCCMSRKSEER